MRVTEPETHRKKSILKKTNSTMAAKETDFEKPIFKQAYSKQVLHTQ